MAAPEQFQFVCSGARVCDHASRREQRVNHSSAVALDRFRAAELGMGQRDQVVDQIDRLDVVSPGPVREAGKVDVGMANVEIERAIAVDPSRRHG